MSNLRTLLTLATLFTSGVGAAQTTTPTEPTPTPVTEPAPAATPVLNSLRDLARSGVTLTLVDANGVTIATLQPDGTLKLEQGASISSATKVKITQSEGEPPLEYPLAARVSNGGHLLVTTINANGNAQSVPLVAALNKAAAAAKKVAKTPTPTPAPAPTSPEATTPASDGSVSTSSAPAAAGPSSKGKGGNKGGKR